MSEPSDFEELRGTLPKPWEAQPTFSELLRDRLRRAPWVLSSILGHALLAGIAMLFASANLGGERLGEIVASVERRIEDPFQPEEESPEPEVQTEDPIPEVPVMREVEVADHDETDDDEPFDSIQGEPDLRSDAPFDDKGLNDVIGIGPGSGGPYGERPGGDENRRRRIAGPKVAEAIECAFMWLRDHQSPDGRWDCDGFAEMCKGDPCDGPGEALHDVGVTGLALLAFLGDGNTHRFGPYRETVRKGIRWLLGQQDRESGLFGEKTGNAYLYDHAIATLALCEAYHLSAKSPRLKAPAQRAVDFIHRARNPYKAWRYQEPPNGDNDSSVTGWMVFALKSAEEAGLKVDRNAYAGALAWFDEMTDPQSGRCGYQQKGQPSSRRTGTESRFPADKTESLTAVALLCRFFLGQTPEKEPKMRLHADLLRKSLPAWEVSADRSLVDEYYWYYGTFAMFQMGGEDWKVWNGSMKKAILEHQRRDGDEKGSWDPLGAWGRDGGRVYMTAIGALCLEVYFRYSRILGAR